MMRFAAHDYITYVKQVTGVQACSNSWSLAKTTPNITRILAVWSIHSLSALMMMQKKGTY